MNKYNIDDVLLIDYYSRRLTVKITDMAGGCIKLDILSEWKTVDELDKMIIAKLGHVRRIFGFTCGWVRIK